MRNNKAFTLLEVLLVVAAIGILATIVVVAINPEKQFQQFRDAQRNVHQKELTSAINQYYLENGTYPASITPTLTEICDTGEEMPGHDIDCINLADLSVLVPDYVSKIPKDPTKQTTTGYLVATNHDSSRFTVITNKEAISCPQGYIPVPGNPMYGTEDFCVMKYEAKCQESATGSCGNPGTNLPISQPEHQPWHSISQTSAINRCEAAGARLISNKEWMTIARNIESVASNWTGNEVGNGAITTGNSDSSASMDATEPLEGINKRTHTLTNGQVIWDMAGNVWNWTDEVVPTFADQPNQDPPVTQELIEWTTVDTYGAYTYDDFRPSNLFWDTAKGVGRLYPRNETSRALRRGGRWFYGSYAGVFSASFHLGPGNSSNILGFRCVSLEI